VEKTMNIEHNTHDLEIIAGPCSVNSRNVVDIFSIADIRIKNIRGESKRAISGTRVVGLKSRTSLSDDETSMGIDFPVISRQVTSKGACNHELPPSVKIAQEIVQETNLSIATEVMIPEVQIPHFIGKIPKNKLLLWNPSVDQLGWHILQLSHFAKQHGWSVGIKNGKCLGSNLSDAVNPNRSELIEVERTWSGLASFAKNMGDRIVFIHRGVETPEKGEFRSAIVHEVARRVKNTVPNARMFFDPSHSCGPKLRDQILPITIEAMRIPNNGSFLYDGILIESGTSDTDTKQHISIDELRIMAQELSKFRVLKEPKGGEII
jgi:3-deoxy-D-arabino-heptulosonate 7-phosphate (DAHP) synthase